MERSRGEIVRMAFDIAAQGKEPHELASVLKQEIMPFFKGNFEKMVEALRESRGPSYQGSQPDIWTSIQHIDKNRAGLMGSALASMAMEMNIAPPTERMKTPSIQLG